MIATILNLLAVLVGVIITIFLFCVFGMFYADMENKRDKALIIALSIMTVVWIINLGVLLNKKCECPQTQTVNLIQQNKMCREIIINHWENK